MSGLPQKMIIQKEVQPMREQYLEELILNINMPHEDTNHYPVTAEKLFCDIQGEHKVFL
jgi:hypothetical protein